MASRVLQKGKNRITQGYHAKHLGIDLGREHITGEPVIAHSAGTVVMCQTGQKNNVNATGNASYGNFVKIDHGNGYATLYAHLATVKVKKGQAVKQGQVLGTMGNTGRSFGVHLHFEVRKGTSRLDPEPYLNADLPTAAVIHVDYRVHTGKKWLSWVTDCNDTDSDGYAGITGQKMAALQVQPDKGKLVYRVHTVGGSWLSWVNSDSCWAGNRKREIDAVQMQLEGVPGKQVQYRVSVGGRWLPWCTGLLDASGDGYAGNLGQAIDRIQVKIVDKK